VTVEVREARQDDADRLVRLIQLLGHHADEVGVRQRLQELAGEDLPQLVAVADGRVIGLCGLHRMAAIHRELPVGRVTILVVEPEWQGRGVGRTLIREAEDRLRAEGCGMIEVTSNERLAEAHRFYEQVGYIQTSRRFAKALQE
jgi:GNAT superfamily N-acetyltransferase